MKGIYDVFDDIPADKNLFKANKKIDRKTFIVDVIVYFSITLKMFLYKYRNTT